MQGSGGIAFNGLTPDMMLEIQRLLQAEEQAKSQPAAQQQPAEQPVAQQAATGASQQPVAEEFELPDQGGGINVVVDNGGQALQQQRGGRELGVA